MTDWSSRGPSHVPPSFVVVTWVTDLLPPLSASVRGWGQTYLDNVTVRGGALAAWKYGSWQRNHTGSPDDSEDSLSSRSRR